MSVEEAIDATTAQLHLIPMSNCAEPYLKVLLIPGPDSCLIGYLVLHLRTPVVTPRRGLLTEGFGSAGSLSLVCRKYTQFW